MCWLYFYVIINIDSTDVYCRIIFVTATLHSIKEALEITRDTISSLKLTKEYLRILTDIIP